MAEIGQINIDLAINKALFYDNKRLLKMEYLQKAEQVQLGSYTALQGLITNFQQQLTSLSAAFNGVANTISIANGNVVTATLTGNNVAAGTHTVKVNSLAASQTQASINISSENTALGWNETLQFTNNANPSQNFPLQINPTDTLQNIRDNINNATNKMGLTANIIASTNTDGTPAYTLVVSAQSGTVNQFTVSGDTDNGGRLQFSQTQAAADADITFDTNYHVVSSSNTLTGVMDGLSMSLTGTGTTTLTVSPASTNVTSGIKTAITNMLNSYNQIITFLDASQYVTVYDDKDESNNTTVTNNAFQFIKSSLQTAVNNAFGGAGTINSLSAIGVSYLPAQKVSDQYDAEKVVNSFGSLQIDPTIIGTGSSASTQLDNMLANNFSALQDYFTNTSTGFIATVGKMISTSLLGSEGSITTMTQAGQSQLTRTGDKIDSDRAKLDTLKSNLLLQYSTINATLQTLQNESDYLSKQYDYLGSLVKGSK